MSDLKCTKCGMEASFADADIADMRKTCGEGNDGVPDEIEDEHGYVRYSWSGEEHNWERV